MFQSKDNKRQKGQAIIIATVLFLFISTTVVLGISAPVYKDVKSVRSKENSRGSFFTSESSQEDIIYRLKSNKQISGSEVLALNNSTSTAYITDIVGGKRITSTATTSSLVRRVETELILGEGFSFNYGVQVGDGGLHMKNTSSVSGNVFSNGPITTDNSPTINGDAISAGPNGLINGINVFGDAYAHTLQNSNVVGDAYYEVISSTVVSGTLYPGSPDQATTTMPISDSFILGWENDAAFGGTSTNCVINSDTTIGPTKFECAKLEITGSPTVTLAGPIWVSGNLEIENTATLKISSSVAASIPIIAHNRSNESGSGTILLKNSATFVGSNNNFILFVSMNNDAEANGGSTKAISVTNSVSGDVLVYAPHGIIELKNSVNLKEVTAYQIELGNSAEIVYDTGLANLLFSSGPSGGYSINNWKEIE